MERYDLQLEVLDGPLRGGYVCRGPQVPVGERPGPGGLVLTGYRGVHPTHCLLSVPAGQVTVIPVGTNPVRMAPHAQVNWESIDPIGGATALAPGSVILLGPPSRGVRVRFVEARGLGAWADAPLKSGVGGVVSPGSTPPWFVGCVGFTALCTAVLIVAIPVVWIVMPRSVQPLGPVLEDVEFFRSVDLKAKPVLDTQPLHEPLRVFVMDPNLERAGGRHAHLEDPAHWDQTLVAATTRALEQLARRKTVFRVLERKHLEWARTVTRLRRQGLPDVFAAIPYQESRYDGSQVSWACARGPWQFMPEVAHRVAQETSLEFDVSGCRLRGISQSWSPTQRAPPFTGRSPYIDTSLPRSQQCQIEGCAVDRRADLELSTQAALHTLGEAWEDTTFRESGAAVQLTILSHNAGYDDRRFGKRGSRNILPALEGWIAANGADAAPEFYGRNLICADHEGNDPCGSALHPETQHYAYNVIAVHLLAVCYYAQEHGENAAFEPWAPYALDESYCGALEIPNKVQLK